MLFEFLLYFFAGVGVGSVLWAFFDRIGRP